MKSRYYILFLLPLFLFCRKENTPTTQIVPPAKKAQKQYIRKEGQVRYGDTLERIFSREHIARPTAFKMISAFVQVFDVRRIKPRKKYAVLSDSIGTVKGFEYFAEKEQTVKVLFDSSGRFTAVLKKIPLITKIKSICGTVETTLYDAILNLGETPELIVAFSDVFQWDVDFFIDPRRGDEFRIVYEKIYELDPNKLDSLGEFVRYGKVLAGQYNLNHHPLIAIYFNNAPKSSGYYDPDGKSFQKTFLKSPLNYRRISSYFTGARYHPILKKVRPHYAVDYAAPKGTPVSAAADGTVIEKGYNRGVGNHIKIRHTNPHYVTLYGHLSRFAKGIRKGAKVKQRDVIGYVGMTGLATGPHLHYAFYENGHPINPLKIKNTSGDPILTENRKRFESVKKDMLIRLMDARVLRFRSPYAYLHPSQFGLGRVGMATP
ncbi:MAG: peptidoglycan DD-metalloendopeptidase family protein [Actinobacteria bacterium]|nr:peptidoglycan DD-metalloendopeptidase family protein [Actinomycetota bacterium]